MNRNNPLNKYWIICKRVFFTIFLILLISELYMTFNTIEEEVIIKKVDPYNQAITIENRYKRDINLAGWRIRDVDTGEFYIFPNGVSSYMPRSMGYDDHSLFTLISSKKRDRYYGLSGSEQNKWVDKISDSPVGTNTKIIWWKTSGKLFDVIGWKKTVELYDSNGNLVDTYKY